MATNTTLLGLIAMRARSYSAKATADIVISPGLEYAARANRMHYAAPGSPAHFAVSTNRLHYAPPDEDN